MDCPIPHAESDVLVNNCPLGRGGRPLPESAVSPPIKGTTFHTPDSALSSPTGVGITDPISQTSPLRDT